MLPLGGGHVGQQALDAGDGRIVVALRIHGQQLQRLELAGGRARDDVRERAAAVDPEFPAAVDHWAVGRAGPRQRATRR